MVKTGAVRGVTHSLELQQEEPFSRKQFQKGGKGIVCVDHRTLKYRVLQEQNGTCFCRVFEFVF